MSSVNFDRGPPLADGVFRKVRFVTHWGESQQAAIDGLNAFDPA